MTDGRTCAHCGGRLDPTGACPHCLMMVGLESEPILDFSSGPEQVPSIPGYEVLGEIGRGGMGVVYRARQSRLDRIVAVKILPGEVHRVMGFAERFQQEARTMAGLSHQNLVGIHDFGVIDGRYYLVMEHVDGLNLRQLMEEGISTTAALDVIRQVSEALQYAHEEGVVHRDIKPENILIDKRGRVKIGDFGLAKMLGTPESIGRLTGSRHVMGTPHYMAPEQVNSPRSVDHRADLYAVGVVLYELLTGELPIGQFAPPSRRGRCDSRLDAVLLTALEHAPDRRFQSASELRMALDLSAKLGARAQVVGVAPHTGGGPFSPFRSWQPPVCVLGIVATFGPWGVTWPDRSVHGTDTGGGMLALLGFSGLLLAWWGVRKQARAVPTSVVLISGCLSLLGTTLPQVHMRSLPLGTAAQALAGLIFLAGLAQLLQRVASLRWHARIPDALILRLKLLSTVLCALGFSTLFVPWHNKWTYVPRTQRSYGTSNFGFEDAWAGVSSGVLLIVCFALLLSRGLFLRRWDATVVLLGGLVSLVGAIGCMWDHGLNIATPMITAGIATSLLATGTIMAVHAYGRRETMVWDSTRGPTPPAATPTAERPHPAE